VTTFGESQRQEAAQVKVLSGVFYDEKTKCQVTTGTPIALLIENADQRSKDYDAIKDAYRPRHADFTYDAKYGIRDHRGAAAGPPAKPPRAWPPAQSREKSSSPC
jgi:chorismate synthase